ncbi:hypothetical protein QYF36_026570 [Acer negundo]|nr:hypothetical protein QYF36_026570 [Acer negundo]
MKASRPFRRNNFRDPGGPTFFSKYSSGSYSNAGTSGMVTKSAIKSTEVHDQKDKVVKEMVVGDDVMNDWITWRMIERKEFGYDQLRGKLPNSEDLLGPMAHIKATMDQVLDMSPMVLSTHQPILKSMDTGNYKA